MEQVIDEMTDGVISYGPDTHISLSLSICMAHSNVPDSQEAGTECK